MIKILRNWIKGILAEMIREIVVDTIEVDGGYPVQGMMYTSPDSVKHDALESTQGTRLTYLECKNFPYGERVTNVMGYNVYIKNPHDEPVAVFGRPLNGGARPYVGLYGSISFDEKIKGLTLRVPNLDDNNELSLGELRDGMIIFNKNSKKFQGVVDREWIDLH